MLLTILITDVTTEEGCGVNSYPMLSSKELFNKGAQKGIINMGTTSTSAYTSVVGVSGLHTGHIHRRLNVTKIILRSAQSVVKVFLNTIWCQVRGKHILLKVLGRDRGPYIFCST